ncbi:MAG: imidazoleglycerol-phosphate dehydratase HisB [Sulfurospirillum sp.]|nr:MAG: imidazoleglycerol-phosphate dehydratase HisB [Sulfurospirillum sp.]
MSTKIERETKETKISLELSLYGEGENSIETGIGFFDHMLEAFSKHSLIDLNLKCQGDIEVDFHHSVEDVGIVIGKALRKEIYPIEKVERFGEAGVVMDEALVSTTMDLSNRAFLYFDLKCDGDIGDFDTELVEEFFRALTFNAGISAHISTIRGKNKHHIVEAAFKSFAVALRRAVTKNERVKIPSTKGVL